MSKVLKSKRTRIVNVSNPLSDILGIGGVDKKIHEIYVGRSPLLSMLAGAPLDNLNPEQEWAFNELKKQYPEINTTLWSVFPHCYFVGQTADTDRRNSDWDYGKLMGGPPSFEFSVRVLQDLQDHHLRKYVLKQSNGNWFISPFKGSHEIMCSFTEGYKELCERVNRSSLDQQPFLENFKRRTGISYPEAKKLASDKDTYWCRYIFDNELLENQVNHISHLPKDTCVHVDQDFYGNISEFLLSKGFSNVITDINETCENIDSRVKLLTKEEINDMNPTVNISNPPYQSPNLNDKKGKGGNNSLYIEFIKDSVNRAPDNGIVIKICPPSALIKSTIFNEPSPTLKTLLREGSLDEIDLTVGDYFSVGTFICSFKWTKGKKQGKVKLTTVDGVEMVDVEDLYYLPPEFTKLERDLFKKIITNKEGQYLNVVRGRKNQECTMERFGYPKVQIGGDGVLGFDMKFYDFMSSQLGLWLLDYIRRHDQMIYHNALTGIHIPKGGFELTEDEQNFIDNGNWVNFSRKE
jgi:hypothetical protein